MPLQGTIGIGLYIGATAPPTTYAGMLWYDTTYDIIRKRNAANSAWVDDESNIITTIASANLRHSDDAQKIQTQQVTYTKTKEILIKVPIQIATVKFDIHTELSGGTAYGRVYVNGVAVGTAQSTSSTVYVTKSEDITLNLKAGDLLQLYCHGSTSPAPDGSSCYVQNFRLYFDIAAISTGVGSNQDP